MFDLKGYGVAQTAAEWTRNSADIIVSEVFIYFERVEYQYVKDFFSAIVTGFL